MTKKDYELIASVFNKQITRHAILEAETAHDHDSQQYSKEHGDEKRTLIRFADTLATELKAENRAFDTDKFLNACGVLNNPFDTER